MLAPYRWKITRDCIDDGEAVGTEGPQDLNPSIPLDTPFRLLDDDKEVYYYGKFGGDQAYLEGPLMDFGMPNAGCVALQLRNPATHKWEYVIG